MKKKTNGASFSRWIRAGLGFLGFGLFLHLLNRIGPGIILDNIRRLGAWFLVTFSVEATKLFLQAIAWSIIQNSFFTPISLGRLFRMKIISDNFNFAIPSANIGGDAIRTVMLRKSVPLTEGIPSVLFDKTLEYIGSTLFLLVAFFLGLILIPLPESLTTPILLSLGVTVVALVFLVIAQIKGVYKTLRQISRLIPKLGLWIEKRKSQIHEMDANFRLFYSRRATRVLLAGFLHFFSRVIGTLEVFTVLVILNIPVSFVEALLIYAVVISVNTAFFLLPGQWGVMETGYILIVRTLGYPPEIGLSISVIRRIRRLMFVGLAILLFFSDGKRISEKDDASRKTE